jgi:hypothetical protein
MTSIDLYEDNGGNLTVVKDDGQPWLLGFIGLDGQFSGKFGEDMAAWASGEWEPSEGDGQRPAELLDGDKHVASWEDGTTTLTRDHGRDVAGFSASAYLGLVLVGDTYETPEGAAEYARAEDAALAAPGDDGPPS